MMNFFKIRNGQATARQWTTGRDLERRFLRLFPNQIVLLFLLLSLRRVLHHPTMVVELANTENVMAPLLNMAEGVIDQ
ncbi:hypothetical protein L6452_42964 [Arctium lappa]|uniref:Uncharacterized protein n=1 Tax=Arctium lappa TaxID=4217 RepID=A0ACB8XJQ3_ARCLA|nr:hypothetical protein L6452_42964 [Arctium lappa]